MSTVNPVDIITKYLNYNNGFYIEAGAADGINQSNTLFLEKQKGWTGILVEPNPEAFAACCSTRPASKVYNCALVSYDYKDSEIEMYFRRWYQGDPGLVTSTFDSPINKVDAWEGYMYSYNVPARTLDSILEECQVSEIDYLSLDVEGYELNVLRGFNFKLYKPKIILLESHDKTDEIHSIKELLRNEYEVVEQPTPHDYIFKYKDL